MRLAQLPPLSLYAHVPWCLRKCPYCDFNSHEARGDLPEAQYVDALVADLEASLPRIYGRRVGTTLVPYSGHYPHADAPRQTAAAIIPFLQEVRHASEA